jgi:hypothetical protein
MYVGCVLVRHPQAATDAAVTPISRGQCVLTVAVVPRAQQRGVEQGKLQNAQLHQLPLSQQLPTSCVRL